MKNPLTLLAVCFSVVCAALTVVLLTQFRANHRLHDTNQQLQDSLRATQATIATLQSGQQTTIAQLTLARDQCDQLIKRLAELEAARSDNSTSTAPAIKPYQAEAFLGQQSLGMAWIIPRNLRLDTNTQRYVYEPVVWLEERMRESFVLHHTNVVEREIESQATYNNNYYSPPFYFAGYPSHVRPRPDTNPPAWPPSVEPYPLPPAFNPGSGAITPPKLGTPANQIKIRPQTASPPPAAPTPVQR